ncbi:protein jag [Fodinisporobacter ferrooxydans]|uniref:RNA-binding protein KhpB n=1 Tax=Fodinisporobacter ferrooxydans TaxID=2901836 RepID=A0ABY4CMN1_9BACL|nr:protein jag [Alicyclobacillaceae bacterium MYW30-H2]
MKKVVATGKTIDEAVQKALQRLQATKEQVNITVLKQPSRGLFGLIGTRDAEVEVELVIKVEQEVRSDTGSSVDTVFASNSAANVEMTTATDSLKNDLIETKLTTVESKDAVEEAYEFLLQIVEAMGLQNVKIERLNKEDRFEFHMFGSDIGVLIGKHGHTLDSLQYLVNLVANKHSDRFVRIVLDAESYRSRRRETLEKLADRLADRAARQRTEVVLEPMSASERKVIHSRLQERKDVKTQSRGEEPYRKIVIIPN